MLPIVDKITIVPKPKITNPEIILDRLINVELTFFFKNFANSININHQHIDPVNAPSEKFKTKSELKLLKFKCIYESKAIKPI